jgi:hypothetical protein
MGLAASPTGQGGGFVPRHDNVWYAVTRPSAVSAAFDGGRICAIPDLRGSNSAGSGRKAWFGGARCGQGPLRSTMGPRSHSRGIVVWRLRIGVEMVMLQPFTSRGAMMERGWFGSLGCAGFQLAPTLWDGGMGVAVCRGISQDGSRVRRSTADVLICPSVTRRSQPKEKSALTRPSGSYTVLRQSHHV